MGGRLRDRVALVFGAGSSAPGWSNGKATAVTFAREGAKVVAVDVNLPAAEETRQIIASEGGDSIAVQANVAKASDVQCAVAACMDRYRRVDILHNNVGIADLGGPVDMSEETWDKVMDVNLKGVFLTCKYVLPIMEAQGKGAIINISSIAAIRWAGYSYIAYYASKAAVNMFTQAVAVQYAAKGIRANVIMPGMMNTPLLAEALRSAYSNVEEMIRQRDAQCPTKKMGEAWDVANAAAFLASDEAKYITGVMLPVDGGLSCRC